MNGWKMRKPKKDEDLVGKVCICKRGKLGFVTSKYSNGWRGIALEVGLPSGRIWISSDPRILSKGEIKEYFKYDRS